MVKESSNGWAEHSMYVRKELSRLSEGQVLLFEKMSEIRSQIAALRVKSGVWGAAGAMIPIGVLLVLQFLYVKK